MIGGVEIDMVVTDSLKALELYEKVFDVEPIEISDFPKGENEVVFSLYDVHFHMLDENPTFELKAPTPDDPRTIWFNVLVEDIQATYKKALEAGCTEIQPVTELPDYGITNAIFIDPYGYQWMIHQMKQEVTHDESLDFWEEEQF